MHKLIIYIASNQQPEIKIDGHFIEFNVSSRINGSSYIDKDMSKESRYYGIINIVIHDDIFVIYRDIDRVMYLRNHTYDLNHKPDPNYFEIHGKKSTL